jgi:hypothetical protein
MKKKKNQVKREEKKSCLASQILADKKRQISEESLYEQISMVEAVPDVALVVEIAT